MPYIKRYKVGNKTILYPCAFFDQSDVYAFCNRLQLAFIGDSSGFSFPPIRVHRTIREIPPKSILRLHRGNACAARLSRGLEKRYILVGIAIAFIARFLLAYGLH